VHIFQKPETEIGNQRGKESDICMVGPGFVSFYVLPCGNRIMDIVQLKPEVQIIIVCIVGGWDKMFAGGGGGGWSCDFTKRYIQYITFQHDLQ
jgi:hypothetical protein